MGLNTIILMDGVEIGQVSKIASDTDSVLATAVIKDRKLAEARIRMGIRVIESEDGRLRIDTSHVSEHAEPLKAGTIVEAAGENWLEHQVNRYATGRTLVACAVGSMAMLVLLVVFKAFFKGLIIVVSLLLAMGAALLITPRLAAFTESNVYPYLARNEQQAVNTRTESLPTPGIENGPPGPATQRGVDGAAPTTTEAATRLANAIANQPYLPDARWVAFFGAWFMCFMVIQILLGSALRATRK